jgi:hypothetical protein
MSASEQLRLPTAEENFSVFVDPPVEATPMTWLKSQSRCITLTALAMDGLQKQENANLALETPARTADLATR